MCDQNFNKEKQLIDFKFKFEAFLPEYIRNSPKKANETKDNRSSIKYVSFVNRLIIVPAGWIVSTFKKSNGNEFSFKKS